MKSYLDERKRRDQTPGRLRFSGGFTRDFASGCLAGCGAGDGVTLSVRSLVLRDAIGPNLARIAPLVIYAAVLLLLRPRADAALAFSRLYCAAQASYLLLMWAATLRPFKPRG